MLDKDKIKIARGVTDIQNVIEHLEKEEKKTKREAWLKEHYKKQKGIKND